jgi:hypothetical protein
MALKRVLPKFPNLVSNRDGPLFALNANISRLPNEISIAINIDTPLHLPMSLPKAIRNDKGITNIKNISYMFERPVGFSNGWAEFAT